MTLPRREIGTSGLVASAIGLGTWAIGGTEWGGADDAASIRAIHAALDEGVDLIDTAPIYGFGRAERIVGEAIRGRRDKVILATKCGLVWDAREGQFFFANAHGEVFRHLGAAAIRRQLEASLTRLGVDCIDLYQTHWQDSTTPIAETMSALGDLQREGKIRAIGVSNVTPAQLEAYAACGAVASAQEQYSMLDRRHEADLLPLCKKANIGFLAYSPLAMGLLSGRMTAARRFAPGDARGGSPRFSPAVVDAVNGFLASVKPIADAHGASLAQLALAWALARPGVTHILSGARDAGQAKENIGAARLALDEDEMGAITARLDAAQLSAPQLYG